ncbi:MAG: hypothetical protein ACJ739_09035 [Acidimicrobiales bacterium]
MLGHVKAARAVAIIVVGAALAGGCQTDREITEPDPVPVTADLLTDALITDDDVPSPFVVSEDADQVGPEIIPEHECDDPLKDLDPEESAQVVLTGGFATLTNTISYFPGQGAAVANAYAQLLSACGQVVVADENLRFTTKPLDFGVLSDNTLPLVVSLEHENGTIEERNLIVMRQGDLISTIRLDGPRPSDKVLLDTVTRVAIGNLGELEQVTT